MPPKGTGKPFAERFWKYVDKTPGHGPEGNCWLWIGTVVKGYGRIAFNKTDDECLLSVPVHRASWLMHFGKIPPRMCVCHKCDIPLCVNPEHLWVGTNTDNQKDMFRKGRNPDLKNNPKFMAAVRRNILIARKYSEAARRAITHCPHGHVYDEVNTSWQSGKRKCRACHRLRERERSRNHV